MPDVDGVEDPPGVAARLADVEGVVDRVKPVPERPERQHRDPPRRTLGGDQDGDPEGEHEGAHVADVVLVLDPVAADLVEEGAGRDQGEGARGGLTTPSTTSTARIARSLITGRPPWREATAMSSAQIKRRGRHPSTDAASMNTLNSLRMSGPAGW